MDSTGKRRHIIKNLKTLTNKNVAKSQVVITSKERNTVDL